jgi:hypothetical protein
MEVRVRLGKIMTLTAVLLPACGGSEARAPDVSVRDSLGIEIVTVPSAVLDAIPGWHVAPEPSLSIGDIDGDAPYLFAGIPDRGVTVLADDLVSVVDGGGTGTREIRLFDRRGRFVRSIGRGGEGPGEFGTIPSTHRHVSGVLAHDASLRRVTVFSLEGELIESWPASVECPWEQCQTVGALADGTVVVRFRDRVDFQAVPVGTRYDAVLAHVGLAQHDGFTNLGTFVTPPLTVSRASRSDALGTPAPLLSLSWDRRILAGREHVIVQDPDRGELLIFDRAGLRRIVRFDHIPVPLSSEQTSAVLEEEGSRFENQPVLASWPVFGDVRLGEDDDIWVGDFRHELITANDAPRRYTLLGIDGRPVARVEMRPDPMSGDQRFTTLARSTRDELRVVTRDGLDVSRVLFFAIEKGGH